MKLILLCVVVGAVDVLLLAGQLSLCAVYGSSPVLTRLCQIGQS
jgi:hypothetical protein